jgi:hypothetical protein
MWKALKAFFFGPLGDSVAFWQKAKNNLHAGKIRMLFVADEIPKKLRRIVEFLAVGIKQLFDTLDGYIQEIKSSREIVRLETCSS